ncbi:hypothetical protein BKK79_37410 (plasmid) [Cupriavidus sp. USMAA2-4]|uniref:hypothetical protein n=1 Tax=Cupriavidus sp. USMAA2-4 TaxID=876364 RepID=UPI0008A69881|nr:hypothetical protein [Cupriavidus sp. USMAA2-4]AOY97613.1 hypothetical protein BKK79_37410 [Cupriavidus sp. USMAA2-4]
MTVNNRLRAILRQAYQPCSGIGSSCADARWDPTAGHVPRGQCGATTELDIVRLVLVCAEPSTPRRDEEYAQACSADEYISDAAIVSLGLLERKGTPFHENLRQILDLCWRDLPFSVQMERTWITNSVLCSAQTAGGRLPASMETRCATTYLWPALRLFPNATIIALGAKARDRLRRIGVTGFLEARSASPRSNQLNAAQESWKAVADEFRSRRAI